MLGCSPSWDKIFQSTRPSRGATLVTLANSNSVAISIHAPLAGRDGCCPRRSARVRHFNPRAPRGARPLHSLHIHQRHLFQSTRPSRGATRKRAWNLSREKFQSTRPSRGATCGGYRRMTVDNISIHAPLAGRDGRRIRRREFLVISIHAPLAGRDIFRFRRFPRR